MVKAIEEGLVERKLDRDKKASDDERSDSREDDLEIKAKGAGFEAGEEEEDEDITIVSKDFVETKVPKIKGLTEVAEEKPKVPRRRITKPTGGPRTGKK
jgi:hypothetical protein